MNTYVLRRSYMQAGFNTPTMNHDRVYAVDDAKAIAQCRGWAAPFEAVAITGSRPCAPGEYEDYLRLCSLFS